MKLMSTYDPMVRLSGGRKAGPYTPKPPSVWEDIAAWTLLPPLMVGLTYWTGIPDAIRSVVVLMGIECAATWGWILGVPALIVISYLLLLSAICTEGGVLACGIFFYLLAAAFKAPAWIHGSLLQWGFPGPVATLLDAPLAILSGGLVIVAVVYAVILASALAMYILGR